MSDLPETVVLLHGLARSAQSMRPMEEALQAAGYRTLNIGYPSTRKDIRTLALEDVLPVLQEKADPAETRLHFVTHSMGGIMARWLIGHGHVAHPGRVVMLGPPNGGSEVVDRLGGLWLFKAINGPAGLQLSTADDSMPNRLGPAGFELGVIAGTRSINPLLSLLLPGSNDGKVTVQRAKLAGMRDFCRLPVAHPFLMRDAAAIDKTLRFLRHGRFDENSA